MKEKLEKATFAAGCFWGVEETFRRTKGVKTTAVGYIGGALKDPTYGDVCSGQTGHAEAVELEFDPASISYEELLKIFFENHNPMSLNQQGPDVGTQYRSAIFFHNDSQKKAAVEFKTKLERSGKYPRPIVTEVTGAKTFYRAEDYHQQYLAKRGQDSCHF